jgi:hypothetical protein
MVMKARYRAGRFRAKRFAASKWEGGGIADAPDFMFGSLSISDYLTGSISLSAMLAGEVITSLEFDGKIDFDTFNGGLFFTDVAMGGKLQVNR